MSLRSREASFSFSSAEEEEGKKTMAGEASGDVECGTATPAEVAAALSGIKLGRSYPATLPECPHCHKKKVQTKLNTYATGGTYAMCVVVGIFSALILWWIPMILDSVSKLFGVRWRAGSCIISFSQVLCFLDGTRPRRTVQKDGPYLQQLHK